MDKGQSEARLAFSAFHFLLFPLTVIYFQRSERPMIGGLGVQELLIVFVIALVLFGGKKLPEVGQNLGKALRGFRQAEEETRRELEEAVKEPSAEGNKSEKTAAGEHGEPGGITTEQKDKKGENV
jgi:sec-independent protein translocase protein TatA